MKVLSINVSQPKEVDWNGRRVTTSIFKTPVTGRRHVGKLNIEGDAQSDLMAHGGEHRAVYVYQQDSYDYWRRVLGIEGWHYGQLGENLTVEGLADSEVCIGDRFQIGTAIFEVTQPRVTCYKAGISTGVPEMPALLVKHKRPGFYFRVIVEGDIEAGDEIIKVSDGPGRMSIVEVDGLLYSDQHPVERLREALTLDALSKGWRGSFQALYDSVVGGAVSGNAGLAPAAMLSAWSGFRPFVVESIVVESEGVRSFLLRPADGGELPEYVAGQHIVVRIPSAGKPEPIRMYSLCGRVSRSHYRIGVKAEPNGVGSNFLHRELRVGSGLEVTAPRGVFTLAADTRPLVLIGAGIGITPLLGMLYAVVAGNPSREVWWIYTTQDKAHYPFLGEVEGLLGALTHCHHHIQFTRPGPGDVIGRDYEVGGRLTAERLSALSLPVGGDYYLCGPPGFMAAVAAALESFGIAASSIKQEAFGSGAPIGGAKPPHLPAGPAGEGPMVDFAKTGIQFRWHPRFASLLEAAEACDVPVNWSCRVGVCHRCETTLFAGDVNYVTPPLDAPGGGNVLLCCSVPRGDVQLDL